MHHKVLLEGEGSDANITFANRDQFDQFKKMYETRRCRMTEHNLDLSSLITCRRELQNLEQARLT